MIVPFVLAGAGSVTDETRQTGINPEHVIGITGTGNIPPMTKIVTLGGAGVTVIGKVAEVIAKLNGNTP